ncbi:hypothetical protein [Nonomuraea sp. NPDC005692]|uniref:hypothetical protein n=1 Tax=Nonomuraea sp. NPDC005692 TaxID=3157168 RepID=UPI0033C002F3
MLEAPAFGWTHPLILVTAVAGLVALVWFGLSRRRSAAPVLAPFLVANRAFLGRSLIALALAVVGNLWLMGLNADNPVAAAAAPLLMIGVGMEAPFGITDGQAMALVPADAVGMAAGFLNTLRGAAEAMVIAAFSAALTGLLAASAIDALGWNGDGGSRGGTGVDIFGPLMRP